jgi:hypothetical protein
VRIVVISRIDADSWLVSEFLDNGIIGRYSGSYPTANGTLIVPGLEPGVSGDITMISAAPVPLLIFESEHVLPLEDRLVSQGRQRVGEELETEITTQVVRGLFQVPFWPYLAATEIPTKRIDIERQQRLPDWRETAFPPMDFAATGSVYGWDVNEMSDDEVSVVETQDPGEGNGIALEYIYDGDPGDGSIKLSGTDGIVAVYLADDLELGGTSLANKLWNSDELLALIDEGTGFDAEIFNWSRDRVTDDVGSLSRFLVIPPATSDYSVVSLSYAADTRTLSTGTENRPLPGGIIIFSLWLTFGLLVALGNLVYRFSSLPFHDVLVRTIAVYPAYLLVSMLLSGLWGLGFIPAALVVSRSISGEGERLKALGVVLIISFIILFISMIIIR